MKVLAALVATLSLTASVCAEAQSPDASGWTLRQEDVRQVAPALEKYTKDRLFGEVWERPGLSQRDRSIVTRPHRPRGDRGDAVLFQPGSRRGSPGLVQYTTDILFCDLWLRPNLTPRDRSLVTISALIATGQVAQLGGHLNRAMDNGLTQTDGAEAITQLAFYAGWPNAFSALPIVKEVFAKRSK